MSRSTLAHAYAERSNSFGFIRLVLAVLVLLSHHWILGWGIDHPLGFDAGGVAVAGFFGLSGFLIAKSACTHSPGRFLWHRLVRVYPGFWACILLTALVLTPALWLWTSGALDGPWRQGPLSYVRRNWGLGIDQYGVGGLFKETPYGRRAGVDLANPSLWTIAYEMGCYLVVAAAMMVPLLRKFKWLLVPAVGGWYLVLVAVGFPHRSLQPLPLLGTFDLYWIGIYGFMFALGATCYAYRRHVPLDDRIAAAALVATVYFAVGPGFFGAGLPLYLYVLLWAGARLPVWFQRFGSRADYSYGVYLYAGLTQQALALLGVPAAGHLAYLFTTCAGTGTLAYASWHLVEARAMGLRSVRLPGLQPGPTAPSAAAGDRRGGARVHAQTGGNN